MRPRCTLRWRTLRGINIGSSLVVPVELAGLVVLARAALDLFFLGEQSLELGIGFVHDRRRDLVGVAAVGRDRIGGRTPTPTTRAHHAPAGPPGPAVSPTAIAASRAILSAAAAL